MFYHCSPCWLESGSIIRPGNYGRVLKATGARHTHWLREQFLEHVRTKEFPDKPSRFTCAFVCASIDSVNFFRDRNCTFGVIYKVELVNSHANSHKTNYNCINPIPGVMEDMYEVALNYWRGSYWPKVEGLPNLKCEEILVESGLRIVEQIP